MKDLIVSTLILTSLLAGWLLFLTYADGQSRSFQAELENTIIPAVQSENWEESSLMIQDFSKEWHKFRRISLYFLNTDTINDIDYGLARSIQFIQARDVSNSNGELNAVIEQFSFLTGNQKLTLQNIF